jgi:hypothetical protein
MLSNIEQEKVIIIGGYLGAAQATPAGRWAAVAIIAKGLPPPG